MECFWATTPAAFGSTTIVVILHDSGTVPDSNWRRKGQIVKEETPA